MTPRDYIVGGNTAFLDAVGSAIEHTQLRHDDSPIENRPDHTIVVITTDGQENSSSHFTKAQIQKMIEHQTKGHGWEFVFLGANMDAVSEASAYGITKAGNYADTTSGVKGLYAAVDTLTSSVRACGSIAENWDAALL